MSCASAVISFNWRLMARMPCRLCWNHLVRSGGVYGKQNVFFAGMFFHVCLSLDCLWSIWCKGVLGAIILLSAFIHRALYNTISFCRLDKDKDHCLSLDEFRKWINSVLIAKEHPDPEAVEGIFKSFLGSDHKTGLNEAEFLQV